MRRPPLLATPFALALVVLSAWLVTLVPAGRAGAQTACSPSKVMVLFDRSTSMVEGKIGSETKWSIATGALEDVVGSYQAQAELGLTVFPKDPRTCKSGGSELVVPATGTLDAITAGLTSSKPTVHPSYWTPIGQTLRQTVDLPDWSDAAHRKFVILVTDGRQSCPGPGIYDQTGELDEIWPTAQIVEQAKALKAKGVTLYVIGFGASSVGDADGVDAFTLNQLAVAGGTSILGCDPSGTDPNGEDLCYFQADDAAGLAAALDAIAVQISAEVCDGKDNNCDGEIDENLTRPCRSSCGSGTEHCVLGDWVGCTAAEPEPEVCGDGKDNDCNGEVDETCACANGDSRSCGAGACAGTQTCVDHEWSDCGGPAPTSQSECDGIDHDCSGAVDMTGCECVPGVQETCGGPDVGQCHHGVRICDPSGRWGDCVGAVGPSPETCDGVDNNCDGKVDNPTVGDSDDDVPHGLCRVDQVCQDGRCVAGPPAMTPPVSQEFPDGSPTGCVCGVGHGGATDALSSLGLALMVVGVVGSARLRRRRN